MKVSCLASEYLIIKTITLSHLSSTDDFDFTGLPAPTRTNGVYQVDFKTLGKKLQKAISKYLSKKWSINDDVNFFVLSCSNHKEQQQYINWLDHMSLFTATERDFMLAPTNTKSKASGAVIRTKTKQPLNELNSK